MNAFLNPYYPAFVVLLGAAIVAGGTFWASFRQSNNNRTMREKTDRLAENLIDATNTITGGDSFCIVVWPGAGGPRVNQIFILPQGKYPLYDVTMRFADLDAPETVFVERSLRESFTLGNIVPEMGRTMNINLDHHGANVRYNIFFGARNGNWVQHARVLMVNGAVARADKVEMRGKTVYEMVSPNFPRTANGEVDWDARGQQ